MPGSWGNADAPLSGALVATLTLILLALWAAAGCGTEAEPPEITRFEPPSGVLRSGQPATAAVRVRNADDEQRTLWVGYSVRDSEDNWHDAPARPVYLGPGAESEVQEMSTGPLATAGPYEARVSVWDERPGAEGADRLTNADRADAFVVAKARNPRNRDGFASLDPGRWSATDKRLGRGLLKAENVAVEDGRLRIKLPAGKLEGGEIESVNSYGYGSYSASIKAARVPSSITGFFLYAPPDFHAEIDVEIFNDESGRILFTTYAGGEQTNTVEKRLPFDATAAFHEYRIDLYPTKTEFSVDGRALHTFEEGLPRDSMKLMVNAWYPEWLPGEKPESDGYTYVDWIQQ